MPQAPHVGHVNLFNAMGSINAVLEPVFPIGQPIAASGSADDTTPRPSSATSTAT
ncbi:MAG: hypothetical protein ACHQ4F_03675 [Candidatus Dormibacteria bacterium]